MNSVNMDTVENTSRINWLAKRKILSADSHQENTERMADRWSCVKEQDNLAGCPFQRLLCHVLVLPGPFHRLPLVALHTNKIKRQASAYKLVEILGMFIWAHIRFQKFLEISKPMCVNPCKMQPKFLAAQRQWVGAKFSPTWKVRRDVDQHIRWDVAPLGKWVRREVPHARSSSYSLARLVSARHDARVPRFVELSLRVELIFLLHRKTKRLTESLSDASQLAGSWAAVTDSGEWCGRGPRCLGFLRCAAYINSCPATGAHIWNRSRVFATSRCLRCLGSLPHSERRRAPANGRAGLWNHSPLRSYTGEGELGFWKALCVTVQALHHGSSSLQVGRCSLPPSSSPSASIGLL
jgi:hypothetical protein